MLHPEIHEGMKILRDYMDKTMHERVCAVVNSGAASWILDPHHHRVVGVVDANNTNEALVVVYLDDMDFEINEDRIFDMEESK